NAERLRSLEQQFTGTATTDAKRMSYIILPRAVMAAWDGDFEEAARLVASAADLGYYDFDRAYNSAIYALYLVSAGKRERALEAAAKALEIAHAADCGSVHGATMCEFARLLCAAV